MKTAVTVITTIQTGIDNWKDLKTTKVFEDSATLFEIKEWVKHTTKTNQDIKDISLGILEFSDVNEI